jgi:integrase
MARRKKGTIYRRKNRPGRVYLRLTIDGQRVEHGSFPDDAVGRQEADAARIRLLAEDIDGVYVKPTSMTLGSWIADWLNGLRYEVAAGNIRPNTLATYEVDLTSKVIPRIGTMKLTTLTRDAVRSLYADLLASGARGGKPLAPKSVKNIANALKRALDDAVDSGVLRANPAARVKTPTARRPTISTWSPSDTQHFLEHVRDDIRTMVLVTATTGMRRSEVVGLTWQAVDLENGVIEITSTVVMVKNVPTFQAVTKTDSSRRSLALDPSTLNALRRHRLGQLEQRLEHGDVWAYEKGLVFTDEIGRIFRPDRFTRTFQSEARRLGLTPIGIQGLRHSIATTALRSGVPIKVMADRLGHSSTSVTMDRYSHVVQEQHREVAVALASMIVGPES